MMKLSIIMDHQLRHIIHRMMEEAVMIYIAMEIAMIKVSHLVAANPIITIIQTSK